MDKKKKIILVVCVILTNLIILCIGIIIGLNINDKKEEKNIENEVIENIVDNDIIQNEIEDNIVIEEDNEIIEEDEEIENYFDDNEIEEGSEKLDFDSELVQSLYPFTGAFPIEDLVYLSKIKNMNLENITNDFILRMGFFKVTKEDWADSYTSEDNSLSISADLLDSYIKDIFGNIKYTNSDFSNTDVVEGFAESTEYRNTYNKIDNTYTIEITPGEGFEDSFAIDLYKKALKYDDRIEIIINPVYIKNLGQDSNDVFLYRYRPYKSYNFENHKFSGELGEIIEYGISIDYRELKDIKRKDLEEYVLTYKLNKENNKYEFYSLEMR